MKWVEEFKGKILENGFDGETKGLIYVGDSGIVDVFGDAGADIKEDASDFYIETEEVASKLAEELKTMYPNMIVVEED